jgi:2-oxoglutarate dehydrogenase E1 component
LSAPPPSLPDPAPWPDTLNLPFVEELYARVLADPGSVEARWRRWFEGLEAPRRDGGRRGIRLGPSFPQRSVFDPPGAANGDGAARLPTSDLTALQDRVDQLVRAYRVRGHLIARVDPLELPRPPQRELDLGYYGFGEADLERVFSAERLAGPPRQTLREILERLRNTYCRSIGVQFYHIDSLEIKAWLQERMEGTQNRLALARKEQLRILTRLTDAVIFEEFVQKKFLGAKSFSLEGSESLIPLLDLALEKAARQGADEIVLGMAHRGRLNVLANILHKSPRDIFREFLDADPTANLGRGDVKYHLGRSSDLVTAEGRAIHVSLCFNPSHLEFVDAIALGRVRAKQDRYGDRRRERGLALLVHGDAAFAGQGIVQETLNLSQLEAYETGGTIHVVVNNQIGFTTQPEQYRSSSYATDVAKMLQIPIFHVNGEDPEAVAQVVELALDFRLKFKRDVVIDMYGYRRRGHNEGDEPSFTQPLLYKAIEQRKSVREGYLDHLLELGGVTREEADAIAVERRRHLDEELAASQEDTRIGAREGLGSVWTSYYGGPDAMVARVETGVPRERLAALLDGLARVPQGFHVHRKIERGLAQRREMAAGKRPLDWAAGEALAFATLAVEGWRVRLTGQDSERGTFSHRHAVLHDFENGARWMPLARLEPDQAPVEIWNSSLSEAGVLGFEYGYSLDCPDGLVAWEAQFGDFSNGAQVIIDQFIVSAEDKWQRLSGLVLLLPHGFEGQGPEHSSARLERFLSLAADDNVQVVNLTAPAQLFHCLRRQVVRPLRKPLIVMSPKSLLRHPRALSSLDELARGGFQRLIQDEPAARRGTAIERVLLCSGKVYYDLLAAREERGCEEVALVRVEQLFPLLEADLEHVLAPYGAQTPVLWVQEEPENMGAWRYLHARWCGSIAGRHPFSRVSRRASASPATGSKASHEYEQAEIIEQAFGPLDLRGATR